MYSFLCRFTYRVGKRHEEISINSHKRWKKFGKHRTNNIPNNFKNPEFQFWSIISVILYPFFYMYSLNHAWRFAGLSVISLWESKKFFSWILLFLNWGNFVSQVLYTLILRWPHKKKSHNEKSIRILGHTTESIFFFVYFRGLNILFVIRALYFICVSTPLDIL